MSDTDADQYGPLSASWTFKQLQRTAQSIVNMTKLRPVASTIHSTIAGSVTSPSSPVGNRTLRAGTTVEMACL